MIVADIIVYQKSIVLEVNISGFGLVPFCSIRFASGLFKDGLFHETVANGVDAFFARAF